MAAEDASSRIDASELLRRLEEGVKGVMSSEGWRSFLAAQARFHIYSPGNVLLILAQNPQATQVAGFHTWRDLGRFVQKGEHGIAILAPVFPKRERDAEAEAGEGLLAGGEGKVAVESSHVPVRFRVAHVFDVAQTDGKPLPQPQVHELRGDSREAIVLHARLVALAQSEGLAVSYDVPEHMPRGAKGYYQPDARRIVLAQGLSPDQTVKTMAHEVAHHMLEHGRGREPGRPTEEAEAEGTAFVVCAHYGLDTSEYSFGYVASWSRDEGGPALVKQVSAAIKLWSSPPAVCRPCFQELGAVLLRYLEDSLSFCLREALGILQSNRLEPYLGKSRASVCMYLLFARFLWYIYLKISIYCEVKIWNGSPIACY